MATKYPLDVKLDSSADQIDDVEYQKEHVERAEDNVSHAHTPLTSDHGIDVDNKTARTSLRSERD
jgi:tRNA1(Val) A37 N6-methylase TrmN6